MQVSICGGAVPRSTDISRTIRYRFDIPTTPKWQNVLEWIEATYYYRAGCPIYGELAGLHHANAVAKMFEMIGKLREKDFRWEDVKDHLECMRQALAAVNADWK